MAASYIAKGEKKEWWVEVEYMGSISSFSQVLIFSILNAVSEPIFVFFLDQNEIEFFFSDY